MRIDVIAEVKIDSGDRLLIFPTSNTYAMIYREGAEVHWDSLRSCLSSPKPREWTHLDSFKHIIAVAGDLALSPQTNWTNVPDAFRREAKEWMKERAIAEG